MSEAKPKRRTYALNDAISEFAAAVIPLVTPSLTNHWKRKVERLWKEEQEQFSDKTPSTQKLYTSKFRKAAKEALADAEQDADRRKTTEAKLMEIIRQDAAVVEDLNAAYRKKVATRHKNVSVVPEWKDLMQEFRLLLNHPNARMKAVAIMALTGRRSIEVLGDGEFSEVTEVQADGSRRTQRWSLAFSGQAKTRGAAGTRSGDIFAIPVLAPAPEILQALREMRLSAEGREWQEWAQGDERKKLNGSLNSYMNKLLRERSEITSRWPEDEELTLKQLRALYAEVAYLQFCPSHMTRNAFYAQVLGHAADDFTTGLSYMRFALSLSARDDVLAETDRVLAAQKEQKAERGDADAPEAVDDDDDEDVIEN